MTPTAAPAWLTAPFAPISLADLEARAAMLERLDNKYVVDAPALRAALTALAESFDVLEIGGRRDFLYETVYFDDAGHGSYHDHHQGRRRRCKVRLRRYVDSGLAFVEVKLKDKRDVTVKKRLRVAPGTGAQLDSDALAHVERAWHDLYGDVYGRPLGPVLNMAYRRVTLVARQGGERMTVDFGLQFEAGAVARRVDPGLFIVETKSANANGLADRVLRSLHQHPVERCSKYCVALAATRRVGRFNRFRPALRRLGLLDGAGAAAGSGLPVSG